MTAAIFRLQFLHAYTISKDPFFAIVPIHIWSMVEVNVGILCASLPTLRPLFSAAQRHRTRAINSDKLLDTEEKAIGTKGTLATSGTIAIGIGSTIRGSWWRPPVPPKSPAHVSIPDQSLNPTVGQQLAPIRNNLLSTIFDTSHFGRRSHTINKDFPTRRAETTLPGGPKLALLKRDEHGIFRPEAVYSPP